MKKMIQSPDVNSFTAISLFLLLLVPGCSSQDPGLKDIFKDYFQIGTALNPKQVLGYDTLALSFTIKHFNSITSENHMKYERIHPKPNVYDFQNADNLVAFGEQHGMSIFGHVLVWHSQTPAWVYQDSLGNPLTREALLARMKDHIFNVVGRYKGKVDGWDVVNEAIDDNGQMRKTKYYEIIGEDYVQKAFEFAHEADPDAKLYLNDYNNEVPVKREGVIKLLKKLQEQGVRVDGVGLQGHYMLGFPTLADIDSSIRIYSDMGFTIIITELDVDVLPSIWEQTYADIAMTAEYTEKMNPYKNGLPDSILVQLNTRYEDLFRTFVKYKDVIDRVTFWGLHDGYSWKNNWPIFGRTNYPLLFDTKYQPKPAYYSVINTVKN
jgi:endo-1,4-beta-xylanase